MSSQNLQVQYWYLPGNFYCLKLGLSPNILYLDTFFGRYLEQVWYLDSILSWIDSIGLQQFRDIWPLNGHCQRWQNTQWWTRIGRRYRSLGIRKVSNGYIYHQWPGHCSLDLWYKHRCPCLFWLQRQLQFIRFPIWKYSYWNCFYRYTILLHKGHTGRYPFPKIHWFCAIIMKYCKFAEINPIYLSIYR